MTIIIDNNPNITETKKITVLIDDVEFDIKVNQFKQLVINKGQFGEGDTEICIRPSVSNEIRLT